MSGALLLMAYALATATFGPPLLRKAAWPYKSPALGILAWLALSVGIVLATALALMSVAVGAPSFSTDLAHLLHTCVTRMRAAYSSPGGAATSIMALAALSAFLCRLGWSVARRLTCDHLARRAKVQSIDLLALRGVVPDVLVLEHTTSYAFCIPGRHHRIVLTSAAVQTLSDCELEAVVAHERAHIAGRHHWLIALPRGLADAFPCVAALTRASAEVAVLIEMLADDAARRTAGSGALGRALRSLADLPTGHSVLAASARGLKQRVDRLASPPVAAHRLPGLLAVSGSLLVLVLPLAVLAAPATSALADALCIIS